MCKRSIVSVNMNKQMATIVWPKKKQMATINE